MITDAVRLPPQNLPTHSKQQTPFANRFTSAKASHVATPEVKPKDRTGNDTAWKSVARVTHNNTSKNVTPEQALVNEIMKPDIRSIEIAQGARIDVRPNHIAEYIPNQIVADLTSSMVEKINKDFGTRMSVEEFSELPQCFKDNISKCNPDKKTISLFKKTVKALQEKNTTDRINKLAKCEKKFGEAFIALKTNGQFKPDAGLDYAAKLYVAEQLKDQLPSGLSVEQTSALIERQLHLLPESYNQIMAAAGGDTQLEALMTVALLNVFKDLASEEPGNKSPPLRGPAGDAAKQPISTPDYSEEVVVPPGTPIHITVNPTISPTISGNHVYTANPAPPLPVGSSVAHEQGQATSLGQNKLDEPSKVQENELKSIHETSSPRLSELKNELSSLNQTVNELKEDIESSSDRLPPLREKIKQSKAQLDDQTPKDKPLSPDLALFHNKIDVLADEHARLSFEDKKLSDKVNALLKKANDLTSKASANENPAAQTLDEIKTQIAVLNTELKTLVDEHKSHSEEISELEEQIKNLEPQLKKLIKEGNSPARMQQQLDSLGNEILVSESDLINSEKRVANLNTHLRSMQDALKKLPSDKNANESSGLQSFKNKLTAQSDIQKKLESDIRDIAGRWRDIDFELNGKKERFPQDLKGIQTKYFDLKKDFENFISNESKAQTSLSKLELEFQAMSYNQNSHQAQATSAIKARESDMTEQLSGLKRRLETVERNNKSSSSILDKMSTKYQQLATKLNNREGIVESTQIEQQLKLVKSRLDEAQNSSDLIRSDAVAEKLTLQQISIELDQLKNGESSEVFVKVASKLKRVTDQVGELERDVQNVSGSLPVIQNELDAIELALKNIVEGTSTDSEVQDDGKKNAGNPILEEQVQKQEGQTLIEEGNSPAVIQEQLKSLKKEIEGLLDIDLNSGKRLKNLETQLPRMKDVFNELPPGIKAKEGSGLQALEKDLAEQSDIQNKLGDNISDIDKSLQKLDGELINAKDLYDLKNDVEVLSTKQSAALKSISELEKKFKLKIKELKSHQAASEIKAHVSTMIDQLSGLESRLKKVEENNNSSSSILCDMSTRHQQLATELNNRDDLADRTKIEQQLNSVKNRLTEEQTTSDSVQQGVATQKRSRNHFGIELNKLKKDISSDSVDQAANKLKTLTTAVDELERDDKKVSDSLPKIQSELDAIEQVLKNKVEGSSTESNVQGNGKSVALNRAMLFDSFGKTYTSYLKNSEVPERAVLTHNGALGDSRTIVNLARQRSFKK